MELMQNTMTTNVNTLQQMSSKNVKFIEDSLKMMKEETAQQQKQMVEIVKSVQERNAKLAKGKCDHWFSHSLCCYLVFLHEPAVLAGQPSPDSFPVAFGCAFVWMQAEAKLAGGRAYPGVATDLYMAINLSLWQF